MSGRTTRHLAVWSRMIDYQACLRAIVGCMKGIAIAKGRKALKGHKVPKRARTRVAPVRKPKEIVVVSAAQYKRLTGPDTPNEVPSALRELVLQGRSANAAR